MYHQECLLINVPGGTSIIPVESASCEACSVDCSDDEGVSVLLLPLSLRKHKKAFFTADVRKI